MQPPDYVNDLQAYLGNTARITYDTQIKNYVRNSQLVCPDKSLPLRVSAEEAMNYIGQEVGISKWVQITQDQVNRFADATGDYQFLHIDQERATRESCYGGTIAHGLLTLSLLPMFATNGTVKIKGARSSIIYGLDRVRYLNPLRIGKSIRARFTLLSVAERNPREVQLRHQVTIDIQGEEKPAMIAEWIVIAVL